MTEIEDITILHNEPMAKHTSWRAGGVARQFVQPQSLPALAAYIADLPEGEKVLWLGLGSNLLVRDGGFDGTVIATQGVMSQLEITNAETDDEVTVYVGAGVPGAKLAKFCSNHGLTGAEFFAGIPGLVGGALAMNAGAWGGETWPLVTEVETLNRSGEIQTRSASEYHYGYRSVQGPAGEWFVSATLRLHKKQLESGEQSGNTIDIKQLLAQRAASQPTGVASCGSVFRNPQGLAQGQAQDQNEEKLYAAKLIEQCGLKGKRIGGAVVSEKHANFIINENNATAADIESLIILIQQTVKEKYGITLKTEVKIVGLPVTAADIPEDIIPGDIIPGDGQA